MNRCPKHNKKYKIDLYTGEKFCEVCAMRSVIENLGKRNGIAIVPFKGRHKISGLGPSL